MAASNLTLAADAVPARPALARSARGLSLPTCIALGFGGALVPLVALTAVAFAATEGAARLAVLAAGTGGVLACLCAAAWIVRRVIAPLRASLRAARELSAGDLTRSWEVRSGGEAGHLMASLAELQQRLFGIVSEVRTGTTTVAATSSQMSRDNQALAERTEHQAASLQQTAASMEQFTATVRQNADHAQNANTLVATASAQAAQGGALMAEVVETMGSIRASSRSIVDIIAVIDGIAFQTNILALNAAVEAARAGDQGRGFAVVAAEVRNLAQRCAAAAKEIKGLIGTSVEKVDAGGRLVDDAGHAMQEIVGSVRQIASLMGQISTASREQSDGIDSVNQAIAQIERATQRNAALVEGANRTASTLNEQAVALMHAVSGFQLGAREHGNAQEAMAMVRAGAAFARSHGRQALIDEVNKLGKGRFIDRDLYLMVVSDEVVFLAHGNNPRTLGLGPQSKDVDGKPFVHEMVRLAKARPEGGWLEYKWAHPVTNQVLTKSTFVQRIGDVVVACGIYAG
jgi:methyl-accepting chemotaxis protein